MHIWYRVHLRFRDLDPLAHVNNTVYFTYFEEARSFYFNQLSLEHWPSREEDQLEHTPDEVAQSTRIRSASDDARYGSLIKENTCSYHLPIIRSDKVEIGVKTVHMGRTSFTMEMQIRDTRDHERIFATGKTVMVWCNYRTGRPVPIAPELRASIEKLEGNSPLL